MTNTIEMTEEAIWEMGEVDSIIHDSYKDIESGDLIFKHDNGKLYTVPYARTHNDGTALGEGTSPYDFRDDAKLVTLTEVEEREVTTIDYVEV